MRIHRFRTPCVAACMATLAAMLLAGWGDRASADDDLLDKSVPVRKIVDKCRFTEGPVVDERGDLYFSDGPNDRIVRRTAAGELSDFRKPCGRANGLTIDREGRLVMCQSGGPGGGRRVTRLEKDGRETVLADSFGGKPFNAPNDLCVDRSGRIYFTDPNFGKPEDAAQPVAGVYRIDSPGQVVLVIRDLQRPNGIVLTPDYKKLYVSDRGTQKLHRYVVAEDGGLTADGILYDFSPDRGVDGMRVDERGNVWAAAGQGATTGLFVVSPEGKLLQHHPMPEFSTNIAFGGPDRKDIFFTASTSVYQLRAKVAGAK
ncbi:MAG: SMP-30/gluconolactonase/LRE family protein [Pirellulales bacterium]